MRISVLAISLLAIVSLSVAQEVKVEGVYQGKNLYVMNPFASGGVGYCVYEVRVNGAVTTDEVNSSAFEVDLSQYQFKLGDRIQVTLKHKSGCTPRVLNPEVLDSKSSFNATAMKVDSKTKKFTFTTTGESGSLPFIVEQFRWNKWIKVGEIKGQGTPGANVYSIQVYPHSGENQFRVKQVDYTKQPRYSKVCKFRSMTPPITYSPQKKFTSEIIFSDETMFELYNPFGNIISRGIGNKVDLSSLKKLDKYKYTLLYDNQTLQFNKE